jgi:hypothetical protein
MNKLGIIVYIEKTSLIFGEEKVAEVYCSVFTTVPCSQTRGGEVLLPKWQKGWWICFSQTAYVEG